jgi:formamidopyrimidine-DNA glycosylase
MPELPDLLYIRAALRSSVMGRTIMGVQIRQPVVLRVVLPEPVGSVLSGRRIDAVDLHGPFLLLGLAGDVDMVMHLMLAGKLQHQAADGKAEPFLCVSFLLDDGTRLNLCDDRKMAKVYVVPRGEYGQIPKYLTQGVPVLSPEFTLDAFRKLVAGHRRKQVRVFLNDQTILSAIGNAYADEILFEARIHPKTFVSRLADTDIDRLHAAIRSTLEWGRREVERAGRPVHVKVREHLRVRNRHGEACPRCGSTIRREGVRGYDVFFCPACQAPSRRHFLDWNDAPGDPPADGSGTSPATRG